MKENVHILKFSKTISKGQIKCQKWKNQMFNSTLTKINMHTSGH
jgi:hypothetical protein